jgi:hypothetical protein
MRKISNLITLITLLITLVITLQTRAYSHDYADYASFLPRTHGKKLFIHANNRKYFSRVYSMQA